jgi:hypothetical protein
MTRTEAETAVLVLIALLLVFSARDLPVGFSETDALKGVLQRGHTASAGGAVLPHFGHFINIGPPQKKLSSRFSQATQEAPAFHSSSSFQVSQPCP